MKLVLTTQEAVLLVAVLEDAEGEADTPAQRKAGKVAHRLRKRIEDLQTKAPKGATETRWAAALVSALAEHEDTCGQSRRVFRRCAEDLDLHADLALGCG